MIKRHYIEYAKYVIEHKKNVYLEGKYVIDTVKVLRSGLVKSSKWDIVSLHIHRLTHDISKFRISEFVPYANKFYGKYPETPAVSNNITGYKGPYMTDIDASFEKSWITHYSRNKHHWEHWYDESSGETREIPLRYLCQMIMDWRAMSRKFGGSADQYYLDNYTKIILHNRSRYLLELLLEVQPPVVYKLEYKYKTLQEIVRICKSYNHTGSLHIIEGWLEERYHKNLKDIFNDIGGN